VQLQLDKPFATVHLNRVDKHRRRVRQHGIFRCVESRLLSRDIQLIKSHLSSVEIKHAGKQHKVEYNPVDDAKAFKESIYQVTGVPTGELQW